MRSGPCCQLSNADKMPFARQRKTRGMSHIRALSLSLKVIFALRYGAVRLLWHSTSMCTDGMQPRTGISMGITRRLHKQVQDLI